MELAFRKIGNSTGVIFPKSVLREVGLDSGARVVLKIEDGNMVLQPIVEHPRAGWAEAAAIIGADPLTAEEEAWLAFGNDSDNDEWTW